MGLNGKTILTLFNPDTLDSVSSGIYDT
jgi:hypothetical protein